MEKASLLANLAYEALIKEVETTPKPGLVDLNNNGAHLDMNINTFYDSSKALLPYFEKFAMYGCSHKDEEPDCFLKDLRKIGKEAEERMLEATKGVNTHKGAIFSLGICLCASSYLISNNKEFKELQEIIKRISKPVLKDFDLIKKAKTSGEKLYLEYGIKGVRGQASEGYPICFEVALPYLESLKGYSENDKLCLTLIRIMSELIDTNVIHRSSYKEALELKERMKELSVGLKDRDYLKIINELDQEFITRNISPGGSADLLALTIFIQNAKQLQDQI